MSAFVGSISNPGGFGPGGENDPFFGGAASEAAKEAAALQAAQGDKALAAQAASLKLIRGDLEPFREAGVEGLGQLQGAFGDLQTAIDDPTSSVINNPFFQALAGQQEQRLLQSQAARGKVGSGGTGDDLQRNLLLLGNQFSQQNIANRQTQIGNFQNLATIGSNAAAQTGTQTQAAAGNTASILGQIGNAQAAGTVGAANAQAQGAQNLLSTGLGLFAAFSDIRLKENIRFSHIDDGIRIYNWDWKDEAKELVGSQDTEGPIAQELKKTRPDLVIVDPDTGYYKVLM
ncbi:MAG: tail fiber domain-containing protein [Colwellia sp.]|nr:tail fiber domain-containing protein [Colwellia sp.]